jgi:PiT family inorganic phosphate transporter
LKGLPDRRHAQLNSSGTRRKGIAIGLPLTLLLLGAGAFVGWNIGANDTANCIGTTVGARLLPLNKAALLVAIFAILGAVLQGQHVMKTVGTGIVKGELSVFGVLTVLLCSGSFVTLATFLKIPVSTSQAIVGGVVGIGMAAGAEVDFSELITIVESWVICPLLVMVLAFGLSRALGLVLPRIKVGTIFLRNTLGWLAILSACYVAYTLGANHAGTAVGPIANLGTFPPTLLLALGGVAIATGAITYGKKVTDTVGKGIAPLDIPGAFSAQICSAFGIHLFSIFGIPISTSSAIVGAVVGVGLVKGAKTIRKKNILAIFAGWVLTPCLTAVVAFLGYKAAMIWLR